MRAPSFWQTDGPAARLLGPLGTLYDGAGVLRRRFTVPAQAGVPVICIGNATAGGTGKTPVAVDLARRLQLRGVQVHLLTRGYRGRLAGPVQVNPLRHDSAEVGDEPLLLARAAPTWVARDRAAGAQAARAAGAQAIVMDDGLQNPSVTKDMSILVVDGGVGFGNGRVIPAGPLRESPARALARADAVALIGADATGFADRLPPGLPLLRAQVRVDRVTANRLRGLRVFAFCGIGRPAKFFDTLRGLGADIVESRAVADHHAYRPSELRGLLDLARRGGLTPVTTEKDAMRLPEWARARVETVPIELAWDEPERLAELLGRAVPTFAAAPGGAG